MHFFSPLQNTLTPIPSLIFSYPKIVTVAPLIGFEELLLRRRLCQWECDEVDLQSDGVEKQVQIG